MEAGRQQALRERLEEWIRLYGDRLLRLCYLWLRDAQLAEDALQETFLKAWKALPGFEERGENGELAFLTRIAVNTCRDMRRGFWFRRVNRALTPEDLPEAVLAISDEDRDLFLSVLALQPRHRDILVLYYYIGLNLRECALALNIKPSGAHYRLKKAEACLKTALEGGKSHEKPAQTSH